MTERVVARSRWHTFIERILPWFDREAEDARNARTEAIRQRSIAARITTEQIRTDYAKAAARVSRK